MSSKKRKKNKILKRIKQYHREISFMLILLACLSVFSLIGTFAWFTSADTQVNKFQAGKLVAEIEETFIPNNKWQPNEKTTKEVRVANTGDIPALVRVSFYEFIMNFEVDLVDKTGNANLKTVKSAQRPEVKRNNTDTWKEAADKKGSFEYEGKFYLANQAWIPNTTNGKEMYQFGSNRSSAPHKYISLNFSNDLKTSNPTNQSTDYWLYSNGYFYFSRPLKPKEASSDLLKSVTLSSTIPNKYKGSLYKLKIYMDAHDTTEPIIGEWDLKPGDPAYDLINSQLKQEVR